MASMDNTGTAHFTLRGVGGSAADIGAAIKAIEDSKVFAGTPIVLSLSYCAGSPETASARAMPSRLSVSIQEG